MLHVILLILKILGIILLVILGLVLLLLYAVLFVAVTYQVRAERTENFRVSASAAWLFRIFTIWFSFEEGSGDGLILQLKLFGYPIWRILGEKKPKKSKKRGKKLGRWRKRRRKPKKEREAIKEQESEELPPVREEPEERKEPEGAENAAAREETPDRQEAHPIEKTKRPEAKQPKEPFFTKIFRKIDGVIRKIRDLIKGIGEKLAALGETFQKLLDRKDSLLAFWNLEEHKRARGALWKEALYLWKKSRPKKIKGKINFGFADPAHTGLCMGAAGMLCAWYPESLEIVPDFEQQVLRGDVKIRGRIRCYIFVRILLRVYFNKDIRHMYEHWKEL